MDDNNKIVHYFIQNQDSLFSDFDVDVISNTLQEVYMYQEIIGLPPFRLTYYLNQCVFGILSYIYHLCSTFRISFLFFRNI